MQKLLLLVCAIVITACDSAERTLPESDSAADATTSEKTNSADYWFPTITLSPPVVPAIPPGFRPALVRNEYINEGGRTLAWGRPDEVARINGGGRTIRSLFTITEEHGGAFGDAINGSPVMTAELRDSFRANQAGIGYTNIEIGSRNLGSWMLDWFSGDLGPDHDFVAWLYKPGSPGVVVIGLAAGEEGEALWSRFTTKTTERCEHDGAGPPEPERRGTGPT